jgi:flagellin
MALYINTNVAALNAQRNLGKSGATLARSFQRLSSGLRINSARDDAAGLAISTRLQSQVRGLNQAVRNTNDGISLSQTVESALEETGNILQRIRQLAVQSANDSNSTSDRESIDTEVQQLIAEMNRIGDTTTFNGQKVLDGSFVQAFFHVGANARETVQVSISDARATALGRAAIRTTAVVTTLAIGNGIAINGVSLRATVSTDDAVSTTLNTASALAKANAINDSSQFTGVHARALATKFTGAATVAGGTLDAANYIIINGQTITGFHIDQFDANDELLHQINAVSSETGVIASLDEQNRVVLTAEDGRNVEVQTVGNAHTFTGLRAGGAGTSVGFGALELSSDSQFEAVGGQLARIGIAGNDELVGVTTTNSVATVNVKDRDGANRTIEVVDRALQQVSTSRSTLGALQNRLESTINNLSAISENVSAANSRILDADFAEETAQLTRSQIIQQAGLSVLAQANQAPQQALSLLRG